jgi:hypothetical protein
MIARENAETIAASNPNEAAIQILATQAASHLTWMLGKMVEIRRDDATERGIEITDTEIVASVRASLTRMIDEAGR